MSTFCEVLDSTQTAMLTVERKRGDEAVTIIFGETGIGPVNPEAETLDPIQVRGTFDKQHLDWIIEALIAARYEMWERGL